MPNLNLPTFERLVEFYVLDLTAFGDIVHRFCNSTTYAGELPELGYVTWNGEEYMPLPIVAAGFQRGGENLVRPSLDVPDFGGLLYTKLRQLNGAYGAPVTRYMALAADIENNVPFAAFVTERYVVNTVARDWPALQLSLATHVDFAKRKVPGVKMERNGYPGLGPAIQRN